MVIPLLGVKTRCADKSTAEHYEHTYIHTTLYEVTVQQNDQTFGSKYGRKNAKF